MWVNSVKDMTKFGKRYGDLQQFITRHNTTPHERPSLRSERLVPVDEFRRLYSVKYEIKPETLALLLLKPDRRIIRKGGVQCFQIKVGERFRN